MTVRPHLLVLFSHKGIYSLWRNSDTNSSLRYRGGSQYSTKPVCRITLGK